MLVVEPDDPGEIEDLLVAAAYRQHVKDRTE